MAFPARVFPSQSLLLDFSGAWFNAYALTTFMGAVHLPEGVPSRDKRDGFFVVHGHSTKRNANIFCRTKRIRFTHRTFRVYVDESHMSGA